MSRAAFGTPLILSAPLLIQWFSIDIQLFPLQVPETNTLQPTLNGSLAMVLPIVTLALPFIGRLMQVTRSAALDQITLDYIRTARAKGCGTRRILRKHVLRNVMIPALTFTGASIPILVSGALIVKAAFNLSGLGYLLWQAVYPKHLYFAVDISILVLTAAAVVLINLLADFALLVVDPRITR